MKYIILTVVFLHSTFVFPGAKECVINITHNLQSYEIKKKITDYRTKIDFKLPSSENSECYLYYYDDVGIAEGGNSLSCRFENFDYVASDRTALMEKYTTENRLSFSRGGKHYLIKGFCR